MTTQRRDSIICDLVITEFTVSMIGDQIDIGNTLVRNKGLVSCRYSKSGPSEDSHAE